MRYTGGYQDGGAPRMPNGGWPPRCWWPRWLMPNSRMGASSKIGLAGKHPCLCGARRLTWRPFHPSIPATWGFIPAVAMVLCLLWSARSRIRIPAVCSRHHCSETRAPASGTHNQAIAVQASARLPPWGGGDIDPADGNMHIRFAIAPVLSDGGHPGPRQPFFFVEVKT